MFIIRQNNKFKIPRVCGSLQELFLLKLCGAHETQTQVATYLKKNKILNRRNLHLTLVNLERVANECEHKLCEFIELATGTIIVHIMYSYYNMNWR